MSKCPGVHCPGCGDGGGGGLIAVVVALAVAAAALYHVRRGIEAGAEIAGIIIAGVIGTVIVAGIGYAAVRVRRYAVARRAFPPPSLVRSRVVRLGDPADRPALGAPVWPHAGWTADNRERRENP